MYESIVKIINFSAAIPEFFFPRICHACQKRLARDDELICSQCRSQIVTLPTPICPICGIGKAKLQSSGGCKTCPRNRHFDSVRGATLMTEAARQIVHEFKYNGHLELAPLIARSCFLTFKNQWAFESIDTIVPIPLHTARQRMRGFNHDELIM